jgi:D-aminopeptidase
MPETLDRLGARRRITALLQPWRDTPGVTVGVVQDGALVLHESAGLASVELGVPIGPQTCFRIASVSKQFTCAAILMLAAEGRLKVADPIQQHLTELPHFEPPVTLDHLMHNSSGMRDMLEIMRQGGVDLSLAVTTEELMEGINRQRILNFAPGSRFLYSNTNFVLLGQVVERVSGETLAAFLERRIFAPLGMTRTRHVPDTRTPVSGLATGYLPREGGFQRAVSAFPIGGEGGLVSCVEDLALWDQAHRQGHIGGAAVIAGLYEVAAFTNGTPSLYLRGLRVDAHRGVTTIGHGGLWPGYRTEFLRAPTLGCTVIAIANNGGIDPADLAQRVLDIWAEGRPELHPIPAMPAPQALAQLAGRWLDRENTVSLDIAVDGTGLTVTIGGATVHPTVGPDGRLVVTHGTILLALRQTDRDTLQVEADAGHVGLFTRLMPTPALPPDLPGTYDSSEMAATWTVVAQDGGMAVHVDGPKLRGTIWAVEPVEGDVVRVWVPGALQRGWFDVRLRRNAAGRAAGLMVNTNRLKGVSYVRR